MTKVNWSTFDFQYDSHIKQVECNNQWKNEKILLVTLVNALDTMQYGDRVGIELPIPSKNCIFAREKKTPKTIRSVIITHLDEHWPKFNGLVNYLQSEFFFRFLLLSTRFIHFRHLELDSAHIVFPTHSISIAHHLNVFVIRMFKIQSIDGIWVKQTAANLFWVSLWRVCALCMSHMMQMADSIINMIVVILLVEAFSCESWCAIRMCIISINITVYERIER